MERYRIVYTNTAADDIAEKFQYIVKVLRDRTTAERWYSRLKESIQQDNVIKLSRKLGCWGAEAGFPLLNSRAVFHSFC